MTCSWFVQPLAGRTLHTTDPLLFLLQWSICVRWCISHMLSRRHKVHTCTAQNERPIYLPDTCTVSALLMQTLADLGRRENLCHTESMNCPLIFICAPDQIKVCNGPSTSPENVLLKCDDFFDLLFSCHFTSSVPSTLSFLKQRNNVTAAKVRARWRVGHGPLVKVRKRTNRIKEGLVRMAWQSSRSCHITRR